MTTETNSTLNNVKEAFAPVTDAFKSMQNLEVPEAAREFGEKVHRRHRQGSRGRSYAVRRRRLP